MNDQTRLTKNFLKPHDGFRGGGLKPSHEDEIGVGGPKSIGSPYPSLITDDGESATTPESIMSHQQNVG
jgi:hypothetical protein